MITLPIATMLFNAAVGILTMSMLHAARAEDWTGVCQHCPHGTTCLGKGMYCEYFCEKITCPEDFSCGSINNVSGCTKYHIPSPGFCAEECEAQGKVCNYSIARCVDIPRFEGELPKCGVNETLNMCGEGIRCQVHCLPGGHRSSIDSCHNALCLPECCLPICECRPGMIRSFLNSECVEESECDDERAPPPAPAPENKHDAVDYDGKDPAPAPMVQVTEPFPFLPIPLEYLRPIRPILIKRKPVNEYGARPAPVPVTLPPFNPAKPKDDGMTCETFHCKPPLRCLMCKGCGNIPVCVDPIPINRVNVIN